MRFRSGGVAVVLAWAAFPALGQALHGGGIKIGRTADGRLKAGNFHFHELVVLDPSDVLDGWAGIDPPFNHLDEDHPEDDYYRLEAGVDVYLRVVAMDDAFRTIDESFNVLEHPGDETHLGDEELHADLTWNIYTTHPNFDPDQGVWHATFIVRDAGSTGYADSEPFTVMMTNGACSEEESLKVTCKEKRGAYTVIAKLKRAKTDVELTFRLDADDQTAQGVTVNDRGKAKAKFTEVDSGSHAVTVVQCQLTQSTTCP